MRKKLADTFGRFARDERGASLLEYTVLIALITVAVVGLITTVGTTVVARWTTLSTSF